MNDNKLKYLEFIQNIITRMNSNSFLVKGWAISLVSAIYALASKDSNQQYIWISILCAILFWGLDAFYLSQERKYISLYDSIAKLKADTDFIFSMNTSTFDTGRNRWLCCLFSRVVWPVYLLMIAGGLVIKFIL